MEVEIDALYCDTGKKGKGKKVKDKGKGKHQGKEESSPNCGQSGKWWAEAEILSLQEHHC